MPGRPHHTEKMKRCVEHVKGKGHDESSAYAICTTSMQNAGEAVYEDRNAEAGDVVVLESAEPRTLHLCGATGAVRFEELNGRRHLVVPVVALMEGVIHPVNADTPEFVSADVLRKAARSWVGKPVTLGHPKKNGTQCSASDSAVRKAAGIGVIVRSNFDGRKLLQEAWIDEEKAKRLDPKMYETLASGGREEVSVGAFAVTQARESDFNGKRYKAAWSEAQGDHLAFLPGGRGACSCDMGCGTHRAAMHFVAAESIELLPTMPVVVFTALEESLDERIQKINSAVYKKWSTGSDAVPMSYPSSAYPLQVFDDRVIVRKGDETFAVSYEIKNGDVVLGEATKVKQQWVEAAAKYAECETCHGTGQVKADGKQSDCPSCGGEGYMKAAAGVIGLAGVTGLAGARHSTSDMKMIQAVHDHAMALGATCDRGNYKTMEEVPPIQAERVKREGTRWALYSADGKRALALHRTEADAKEHLGLLLAKCG